MEQKKRMKSIAPVLVWLVLAVVFAPHCLFAAEPAEMYNQANHLYSSQKFNQALELYRKLVQTGVKNPSVYYNLANTYYKTGQPGYAILYYEKALELKPLDMDIRENLDFVRNRLEQKITPAYSQGLLGPLGKMAEVLKLKGVVFLEMAFFTLLTALAVVYISFPGLRTRLKNMVIVFAVLFTISFGVSVGMHIHFRNHPRGVVVEKTLEVKNAPIPGSDVLFSIKEGIKVKVIEKRKDWLRISIPDGREGWTRVEEVELI
ncbi:MAG: tetratricopeptide repeat protein [Spirochaetota bacterium]